MTSCTTLLVIGQLVRIKAENQMKETSAILLTATLITLCGCTDQSAYDAALQADVRQREAAWAEAERVQAEDTARREKAWSEAEAQFEKEKELMKRWEALLSIQEEQAKRFDAILDKWESLPLGKAE
jgi:hypothetical protein